jgi:hypothetical protein
MKTAPVSAWSFHLATKQKRGSCPLRKEPLPGWPGLNVFGGEEFSFSISSLN